MSKNEQLVKIIQFGKGNFLRAFSTWMVEILNRKTDFNGHINIVETFDTLNSQQFIDQVFKYHVIERGIINDSFIERTTLVNCVKGLTNAVTQQDNFLKLGLDADLKFIISNTTEAGIEFKKEDNNINQPQTFPGRLTALLFHRYTHLEHLDKPIFILPCELIDNNADVLKDFVLKYSELWKLPRGFLNWLNHSTVFCNTLVDRIVSGFPENFEDFHNKTSFKDSLMVECEPFHFWAIEDKGSIREALPIDQTELNVQFVEDIKPYKEIKVRILNGAHTAMVALGMVHGIQTVDEFTAHPSLSAFLKTMLDEEVLPTLSHSQKESTAFRDKVYDRFKNPFLKHQLSAIQLNSISKFRSRLLPSLREYIVLNDKLPAHITQVLANLIWLYRCDYNQPEFKLRDEPRILDFFKDAWRCKCLETTTNQILRNSELWGEDLTAINGLHNSILTTIQQLKNQRYLV